MRVAIMVSALIIVPAAAQAQAPKPPEMILLTRVECRQITKRPKGDFFVNGPIKIGEMTIQDQTVSPNEQIMNGIDNFDIIQRSCFSGRPI
jgi:hypothetical protein